MLLTGEAFFSADSFAGVAKIIVFHSRCSPRGDQAAVAVAELGENPHSMKLYNPNWSGELLKHILFKLKDAAPLHEQRHPANFLFPASLRESWSGEFSPNQESYCTGRRRRPLRENFKVTMSLGARTTAPRLTFAETSIAAGTSTESWAKNAWRGLISTTWRPARITP